MMNVTGDNKGPDGGAKWEPNGGSIEDLVDALNMQRTNHGLVLCL